jgi:hypothetical protein
MAAEALQAGGPKERKEPTAGRSQKKTREAKDRTGGARASGDAKKGEKRKGESLSPVLA